MTAPRPRYWTDRLQLIPPRRRRSLQLEGHINYLKERRRMEAPEITPEQLARKLESGEWQLCAKCETPWPATRDFFHVSRLKRNGLCAKCKICRCAEARVDIERRRREKGIRPWREVWPNSTKSPGNRPKRPKPPSPPRIVPARRSNFFASKLDPKKEGL